MIISYVSFRIRNVFSWPVSVFKCFPSLHIVVKYYRIFDSIIFYCSSYIIDIFFKLKFW